MQPRIVLLRKNLSGQGGAENYLHLLCRALAARNYHILLLTDSAPSLAKNLPVEIRRPTPSLLSAMASFPYRAEIWCKKNLSDRDIVLSLDRNRFQHILRSGDGVHAAWLRVRALAGRLTALAALRHTPLLRAEKLAYDPRRTALIWANSHWVAQQIQQFYNFPVKRISVIHNGVDTSKWTLPQASDVQLPVTLPKGATVLLFIGSGWWRKGWDIAVRIHAEIYKTRRDVWLVGIGKPGKEHQFRVTLRQQNVVWLGPLTTPQLLDCFAVSHLLVLPSRYDPFANVTLEALACGVPVLTSTDNGAAEILQDAPVECGVALPLSAPLSQWAAMACRLCACANNISTRELCRKLAAKYDISSQISLVVNLIQSAATVPMCNFTPMHRVLTIASKKLNDKKSV